MDRVRPELVCHPRVGDGQVVEAGNSTLAMPHDPLHIVDRPRQHDISAVDEDREAVAFDMAAELPIRADVERAGQVEGGVTL